MMVMTHDDDDDGRCISTPVVTKRNPILLFKNFGTLLLGKRLAQTVEE